MTQTDDDSAFARDAQVLGPVPISALAQYSYCPRRCGLIHVDQVWEENIHTLRGRLAHERVHEANSETDAGVRIERAVPVWSERLGIIGRADVVEYRGSKPYPVEHKVGRRRDEPHAPVQLCAQAMCLEEMTGSNVSRGAVYYHSSRRRREVVFTKSLRAEVQAAVAGVRAILARGEVPPPANDKRCRHCSLRESCLPRAVGEAGRLSKLRRSLFEVGEEATGGGGCTRS